MSARLEAATHQFGAHILVSEWFYNELSPAAKKHCRMVDRICVVGSKIPMEIWTVDVFNYNIDGFLVPTNRQDGVQQLTDWGTHSQFREMAKVSNFESCCCCCVLCVCVLPGLTMFFFLFFYASSFQGVQDGWKAAFDTGVQYYLSGNWPASIASLNKAEKLYGSKDGERDGPTKSLLTQMEVRGNVAPADWVPDGQTSGFRQLTSK
jgi:hypothetical protein